MEHTAFAYVCSQSINISKRLLQEGDNKKLTQNLPIVESKKQTPNVGPVPISRVT